MSERVREELPFMPLYVRDWLTGSATKAMSPAQLGAFVNLLCHAWTNKPPCSLPDDDAKLAKWSGMDRQWRKDGQFVKDQFPMCDEGYLRNPKQWEVYSDMMTKRGRRQLGADKTNAKRHAERSAAVNAQRDAQAIASHGGGASRVATANATDLVSSSEESKSGEKPLTPQQASVAAILAALSSDACSFVAPTPARVAAWVRDFGEVFVLSVIRDVGASLDGKSASYLHAILRDRFAAGWRPSVRRLSAPAMYTEPRQQGPTVDDIRDLKWALAQDEWTLPWPFEVVSEYVMFIRAEVDAGKALADLPSLETYAQGVRV